MSHSGVLSLDLHILGTLSPNCPSRMLLNKTTTSQNNFLALYIFLNSLHFLCTLDADKYTSFPLSESNSAQTSSHLVGSRGCREAWPYLSRLWERSAPSVGTALKGLGLSSNRAQVWMTLASVTLDTSSERKPSSLLSVTDQATHCSKQVYCISFLHCHEMC